MWQGWGKPDLYKESLHLTSWSSNSDFSKRRGCSNPGFWFQHISSLPHFMNEGFSKCHKEVRWLAPFKTPSLGLHLITAAFASAIVQLIVMLFLQLHVRRRLHGHIYLLPTWESSKNSPKMSPTENRMLRLLSSPEEFCYHRGRGNYMTTKLAMPNIHPGEHFEYAMSSKPNYQAFGSSLTGPFQYMITQS